MSEYQDNYEKQVTNYAELLANTIKRDSRFEWIGCVLWGLTTGQIAGTVYILASEGTLDTWRWVILVIGVPSWVWLILTLRSINKRLRVLRTMLRSLIGFHTTPSGSNIQLHHAEQFVAALTDLSSKKREDTPGQDSARGTDPRVPT